MKLGQILVGNLVRGVGGVDLNRRVSRRSTTLSVTLLESEVAVKSYGRVKSSRCFFFQGARGGSLVRLCFDCVFWAYFADNLAKALSKSDGIFCVTPQIRYGEPKFQIFIWLAHLLGGGTA